MVMSRQIVVSDAAYARLAEIAGAIAEATGVTPAFEEVLDSLLRGLS